MRQTSAAGPVGEKAFGGEPAGGVCERLHGEAGNCTASAGDRADASQDAARRRAMEAFACADPKGLETAWARFGADAVTLRAPEAGLVMLRGRMGGGGAPFNLGEASVSRASVRLSTGEVGHAMVLGRDLSHARLAALFDAGWQRLEWRAAIEATVVAPALTARDAADRRSAEETEATRVDFFTMVRGDD